MSPAISRLTISMLGAPGQPVLKLAGEVDMATAPELDAVLSDIYSREPCSVVIDLRGLTFMDSTGLRLLLSATNACRENGHELQIIKGGPNIERLFAMTGMSAHLPVVDPDQVVDKQNGRIFGAREADSQASP